MQVISVILSWLQAILAILLIGAILLQRSEGGLGSAFGGASQIFHTKRGAERGLFIATAVLASLFVVASILALVI